MKRVTPVLILGVLMTAVPVLGGPLMRSQVSATASWLVHADYEKFCNVQIGRLIIEELRRQGIDKKLDDFATVFSFHPLNDIRDVTIYGTGADKDKAVVLIDGKFDQDKLVALVSMNPEHKEVPYSDIVLHGWVDKKQAANGDTVEQQMYGCFYGNLLVISSGLEAAKQAVDVLKGSAKNASGGLLAGSTADAKDAFVLVMGSALDELAEQQPKAAMLKQADELTLVVGEAGGNMYIDLGLKAKSEDAAESIRKMFDGFIAFANLSGQEQPKLAELAKKLQLSRVEKSVRVRFESDSESVFAFLKEKWQEKTQEGGQKN